MYGRASHTHGWSGQVDEVATSQSGGLEGLLALGIGPHPYELPSLQLVDDGVVHFDGRAASLANKVSGDRRTLVSIRCLPTNPRTFRSPSVRWSVGELN